jgi:hypothetical protein
MRHDARWRKSCVEVGIKECKATGEKSELAPQREWRLPTKNEK